MRGSLCLLFSCIFILCAGYLTGPTCDRFNEKMDCVRTCPPERNCQNRNIQFNCLNEKKCQQKCICKEGYIRNLNGACVPERECDLCTGDHEYFECGPACDHECSKLHTQNKTNCPIVNIVCNKKCYCQDGYARDERNICVPVEKCNYSGIRYKRKVSRVHCQDSNEVYRDCKQTCPPELCFSLVAKFKCDSNATCTPGCACMPGYLRKESDSPCMPLCECPQMKNSPDCIQQSKHFKLPNTRTKIPM